MKKILLLSTVLSLAAGAALADVALSGDGRMGLSSTDAGKTTSFDSRARVRFALSAEADSGLKFGGQFRASDATNAAAGTRGTVFIEHADYGRLTMGDIDGAVQAAVVQFVSIGHNDTGKMYEFQFLTGGDQNSNGIEALYAYTNPNMGNGVFGAFLSKGNPGAASGNNTGSSATQIGDDYAVGVSYTTEFWRIAAGYEDNGVRSQSVVSGSYGNGQAEVKVAYGMRDDDKEQYVVYGTYIIGTNTLTGFYRQDYSGNGYQGFGVTHDLGSGLSLAAGYAEKDTGKANLSIGANMSF
jgi:outer membrane protein OmpU